MEQTVATFLRSVRIRRSISQARLAYMLGCSQSRICLIEAGLAEVISPDEIGAFSKVLQLTKLEDSALKEVFYLTSNSFKFPPDMTPKCAGLIRFILAHHRELTDQAIQAASLDLGSLPK